MCNILSVLSAKVAIIFPSHPPLFTYGESTNRGRLGNFVKWCRTSAMKMGIKLQESSADPAFPDTRPYQEAYMLRRGMWSGATGKGVVESIKETISMAACIP